MKEKNNISAEPSQSIRQQSDTINYNADDLLWWISKIIYITQQKI